MAEGLRAFKNDPALQIAFLDQMAWHRDQDKIIQASYGDACNNGDFQGCFIGCAILAIRMNPARTSPSGLLPRCGMNRSPEKARLKELCKRVGDSE